MNYNTQMMVYLIPVPVEIADIINSFLFYDKKTGETILSVKKTKKKIMRDIHKSVHSSYWIFMGHSSTHWTVEADKIARYNFYQIQLQAVTCNCCGQYKLSNIGLTANMQCRCL